MRRLGMVFALLWGCSSNAPASPCADVVCGGGTTCDESDGLCHCGASICGEGELCEGATCVTPLPAARCVTPSEWAPGTAAFVEVTDAWGLRGIEGVRLNVVDVDGDGLTDLLVRRGGQGADGFEPETTRRTWLLRNTGAGFEDVTQASGLLARRDGGQGRPVEIAAFGDVDGDGDLDAYLGVTTRVDSAGDERPAIFLNDGSGHFTLGPESDLTDEGIVHVPAGASFVDFDRDGHLDLFVPQHNFTSGGGIVFLWDRLYRGDGTGAFTEVTDEVGLMTEGWSDLSVLDEARAHSRAWASLARDLDGDGVTELLVPSYGRAPNHLWRGTSASEGIRFANESVASGFAYDPNQTWQDNQFALCFCASAREAEGCADLPPPAVSCSTPNWNHDQDRRAFRLGGNSAQVSAGDVDNDGDLDLLTGEIKHWWAGAGSDGGELLINDGAARFDRPSNATTGLQVDHGGRSDWDEGHMTNALFDFDNDGRLDVYVGASDYPGNRGHLFHNEGASRFSELATADFFEHNRSHGVVVADFDRDGDLDVVVGHSRARCGPPNDCYETANVRVFENVLPAGNFVQLRLRGGEGSNGVAIGAQVHVRAGGLQRLLEVDGGSGHYGSQEDLVQHVGLGAACEAEVTVRWPDAAGTTETFTLPAGHRFELAPGERPLVIP
ncbi:MAG: CRTAC1 family protein [Sandaracinus sp.]|nr:CRTAC1 family protein [Sandaracinus sp.]MCB9619027.1 CRTAC1 family protein [Sandaracinus sp.]